MRSTLVIAVNTFREIIRDRILYSLMVFAVLLIALSLVLGELSYAEQARISADFGFVAINLSAIIIAIFIGSTLVWRELEQRTVFTLLSRPISREQFLIGKFIGLFLVNLLVVFCLSFLMAGVFYYLGTPWDYDCTMTIYGILLESLVLMSITLLFGTVTRPMLVVSFSIGTFIIGRGIDSLNFFADKSQDQSYKVLNSFLQRAIPNLSRFGWSSYVLIDDRVPLSMVAWSTVYAAGWISFCVLLAAIIFRKKDFV